MKVFKFGGASVKDAKAIKNVVKILQSYNNDKILIVLSAMGKTTNHFEEIIDLYLNKECYKNTIQEIQDYHHLILTQLGFSNLETAQGQVNELFVELFSFLEKNKSPNYDYVYDQVVCFGELLATTILSEFLTQSGIQNQWIDARDYIKTNSDYREGKVQWEQSISKIQGLEKKQITITQGFVASNENHFTTTLGREGSDFSAAVFAYALNASELTIWKDVEGVLNADPRHFASTQLLTKISYREAIEMTYFGASVIHPKTLRPLRKKNIPLLVRSFEELEKKGTKVHFGVDLEPKIPCYIAKKNQTLLILTTHDYSFITEEKLAYLFETLYNLKLKANVLQTFAVSVTICLEDKYRSLNSFEKTISDMFHTEKHSDVSLLTIRNHIKGLENDIVKGSKVLLRQKSQNTMQIVTQKL